MSMNVRWLLDELTDVVQDYAVRDTENIEAVESYEAACEEIVESLDAYDIKPKEVPGDVILHTEALYDVVTLLYRPNDAVEPGAIEDPCGASLYGLAPRDYWE